MWAVVDAENSCDKLKMKFQKTCAEQMEVAGGFQKKSKTGFINCVGCIDCMLVWTEKPSEPYKCGSDVGTSKKFVEGRNKLEWYFKQFVIIYFDSQILTIVNWYSHLIILHSVLVDFLRT